MLGRIVGKVFRGKAPPALRWRVSLKSKLSALSVGLLLVFVWAIVLSAMSLLRADYQELLAAQQFATAQRLAVELDTKLQERVRLLSQAAADVPESLQVELVAHYLEHAHGLHPAFSGGMMVIGLDGRALADFPVAPNRRGMYFGDRTYFQQAVVTGQPYIDKPMIGRALKRPVLPMSVPVLDGNGKVRAVLVGVTDLTAPNFLGLITDRSMTAGLEFSVVAPRDNVIVAATNAERALKPPPPPGRNLLFDRFVAGFEGSVVAVSSNGIPKLYSATWMRTVRWLVMVGLPAEIAFEPLASMRRYLFGMAAAATLIAILLIRWLARRLLAPLDAAGDALRQMIGGQAPLAPLPVVHDDEIGQLVGSFNLLVQDRSCAEHAQLRLNRALRLISDCNMALVHADKEQSLLHQICHLITTTGNYRMAWVGYAEFDEDRSVRPVCHAGFEDNYLRNLRVSWADVEHGHGPTGMAIRTGQAQVNRHFATNPAMAPWRDEALKRGYQSNIGSCCTTSRRSISPPDAWWAWRRWCAGKARTMAWCRPGSSYRWRKTAA